MIHQVAYKDLFGLLPTSPIVVDLRSILEKDVTDARGGEVPLDTPSGQAG